jgi:hypothetical protein
MAPIESRDSAFNRGYATGKSFTMGCGPEMTCLYSNVDTWLRSYKVLQDMDKSASAVVCSATLMKRLRRKITS